MTFRATALFITFFAGTVAFDSPQAVATAAYSTFTVRPAEAAIVARCT